MAYCTHCGGQIPPDASFCPYCGQPAAQQITAGDPAPVVPAQPVTVSEPTPVMPAYSAPDYSLVLVSLGTCRRTYADDVLQDIMGYSAAEAKLIVRQVPVQIAQSLTIEQAQYIAQALTEYGMQVAIYLGSEPIDLGQRATSSVFNSDGSFVTGVLAALALPAKPETRRTVLPMAAAGAALCFGCALVTRACLGAHLQQRLSEPFYEMVRSVGLLGFSQRLESLVSAVLTAGFFLAFCLLGALGGQLLSALAPGLPGAPIWVLGAGLLVSGWASEVPENIFFGLAATFCVGFPLVTQVLVKWRKKAETR